MRRNLIGVFLMFNVTPPPQIATPLSLRQPIECYDTCLYEAEVPARFVQRAGHGFAIGRIAGGISLVGIG
jgi:hypothetical protein